MNLEINSFLNSNSSGVKLIEEYVPICNSVLFQEPEIILSVAEKLKQNVIDFAVSNSPVYQNGILSNYYRQNLLSHKNWFVDTLSGQIQNFTTSGSSSGESFTYGVWQKYIPFLEDQCHYGMILDEFEINKNNSKILILNKLSYNPKQTDFIYKQEGPSNYTLHTHKTINSTRYFVNFDEYITNTENWFQKLIQNIGSLIPFDIIMITGPVLNILCHYLKKTGTKLYLSKLISQTGQFTRSDDIDFVIDNSYANYFCDHMRCWDGGCTFFTCKHKTYHLLDNLSWSSQDMENKLITTDYFSLPAPFINYWNGDLCEIKNKYSLCKCGRYYRPFKMIQNRPFELKGSQYLTTIKQQISQMDFKYKIGQIQFSNLTVNVFCQDKLEKSEVMALKSVLKDYEVQIYE